MPFRRYFLITISLNVSIQAEMKLHQTFIRKIAKCKIKYSFTCSYNIFTLITCKKHFCTDRKLITTIVHATFEIKCYTPY